MRMTKLRQTIARRILDCGERLDNVPILLHERGRRKTEVVLDLKKRLAIRFTVQDAAPSAHPIGVG